MVWARVPQSSADDAVAAVVAARDAFPAWSMLPPDRRSDYLEEVAELFRQHGEELARLESTDNGNPLAIMTMTNGPGMTTLWNRKAHETCRPDTSFRSPASKRAGTGTTRSSSSAGRRR